MAIVNKISYEDMVKNRKLDEFDEDDEKDLNIRKAKHRQTKGDID